MFQAQNTTDGTAMEPSETPTADVSPRRLRSTSCRRENSSTAAFFRIFPERKMLSLTSNMENWLFRMEMTSFLKEQTGFLKGSLGQIAQSVAVPRYWRRARAA
ncbi:MAG: hypothetical protein M3Z22_08405, partial [Verrucomicrobiota bacterium]|nr:hypothetical protein [Verrucomicrobiota bacterium]